MARHINTLVHDVYEILENDADHSVELEVLADFGHEVCQHTQRALKGETRSRDDRVLYASELGKPCTRQLAYGRDAEVKGEPLKGYTKIKFLYGNISEELLLLLVEAAGHTVEGQQQRFEHDTGYKGWKITGRQDCVIDGEVVDVKTAAPFAYQKVKKEGLTKYNDSFGYRDQIWFYHAMQPELKDHNPKFLYMDKSQGHIMLVEVDKPPTGFLDYNSNPYLEQRLEELEHFLTTEQLPERMADADVVDEKTGNRKLSTACSYCPFKRQCWPNLRVFMYAGNKPLFLTEVKKTPRVLEVTDAFYKEESI